MESWEPIEISKNVSHLLNVKCWCHYYWIVICNSKWAQIMKWIPQRALNVVIWDMCYCPWCWVGLKTSFLVMKILLEKTRCFQHWFFVSRIFSFFFSIFSKTPWFSNKNFDLASKKCVIFFLLENNLGTIWADFAQSEHHNLGKINHNIDSGQSIACQGEGCVLA